MSFIQLRVSLLNKSRWQLLLRPRQLNPPFMNKTIYFLRGHGIESCGLADLVVRAVRARFLSLTLNINFFDTESVFIQKSVSKQILSRQGAWKQNSNKNISL